MIVISRLICFSKTSCQTLTDDFSTTETSDVVKSSYFESISESHKIRTPVQLESTAMTRVWLQTCTANTNTQTQIKDVMIFPIIERRNIFCLLPSGSSPSHLGPSHKDSSPLPDLSSTSLIAPRLSATEWRPTLTHFHSYEIKGSCTVKGGESSYVWSRVFVVWQ